MKGIIVLDGPDGSGKTTLANYFRDNHGARVLHLTYRWKDRMPAYHYAAIQWAIKQSRERLVVIDRWWMSEVCYANAYRGGSKWPTMGRDLDRILLKHAGLYVVCLPVNPREHLNAYEVLKTTRDELYNDITPAVIEYHKLWDRVKTWPHVMRYDYFTQGNPLDTFAAQVLLKLQAMREEQYEPALSESKDYLGHLGLAKYLMIGTDKDYRYPMWGSEKHLQYVTQTLDQFNFPEHWFFWVRTFEQGKEIVSQFDIQPICLGWNAFHQHIEQFIPKVGRDLYYLKRAGMPIGVTCPEQDLRVTRGAQFPTELVHKLVYHERTRP